MNKILLLLLLIFLLAGCTNPQLMANYEGAVYLPAASDGNGSVTSGVAYYAPGNPVPVARDAACDSIAAAFQPSTLGYAPISTVVGLISTQISTASQTIYTSIIGNSSFQNILRVSLSLFIVIYGIAVMTGLANPSANEFIMRTVKIALIITLTSSVSASGGTGCMSGSGPIGWLFFNNCIGNFFTSATNYLISVMTCNFSPVASAACSGGIGGTFTVNTAFITIDQFFTRFFNMKFWQLPFALALTSGYGFFTALALLGTVILYFVAILNAVYLYVMSLIARALLFAIAPIFFIFLLFGQTRSLFEGWLRQLINFSLQPVFVFAFVAFFNGIIISLFLGLFGTSQYLMCFYTWREISAGGIVASVIAPALQFLATSVKSALDAIFAIGSPVMILVLKQFGASPGQVAYDNILATNPQSIANAIDASIGTWKIYWWKLFTFDPKLLNITYIYSVPPVTSPPTLPVITGETMTGILIDNQGAANDNLVRTLPAAFDLWNFGLIGIMSYLMLKMDNWARDVATNISEGLTQLPASGGSDLAKSTFKATGSVLSFGAKGVGYVTKPFTSAGGYVTRAIFGGN